MLRAIAYHARRAWYGLMSGPRAVLALLLAPFRWIGTLFVQLWAWWSRRETRYLLRGLPALFVFVGAGFLVVACRMRSDAVLAETYLSAARAKEASQPEVAALLLERVVVLRQHDNETLFELASMAQQSGDQARTAVLMQQLAPADKNGYWPAHLHMGKSYLKLSRLSLAHFRSAESQFQRVLSLDINNADAFAYLGQLYYGQGLWELAILNFEQALKYGVDNDGEVRADLQVVKLLLAKAYAFENELEKSEKLAIEARRLYATRVARQPKNDVESRIILADAYMFLEDFEGAAKTLNEGMVLNGDNPSLRAAKVRFNIAWADALENSETEGALQNSESLTKAQKLDRRFALLSSALLLDPNYYPIFDGMMKILEEQDATSDAARQFLLENVTAGRSTGLSHLLLGSAAFADNDADVAAYHLERAYDALPDAFIVTNNLAWFLTFNENPDLDRALELINDVLKRVPNDPRFLDTRGQIYTKQERWDAAIADLERALIPGQTAAETHAALAVCYAAKGLPALEQRHRQIAETIQPKEQGAGQN